MKFVITGGAGFIGSHLAKQLIDENHSVSIIDNLNTGKLNNLSKIENKVNFIHGDIRDVKMLREKLQGIDGVFHEAALASVQESFTKSDEYHEVNVKGTENILSLAKEYDFKVVYASSSSVYGNPVRIPIHEEDPKNPINPYAQTKLEDENLARKYAERGVRVIGLRYFNVFGDRQSQQYAGVIKKFLRKARDGEAPIINGDGTQTRDFVHVDDVVRANIMAMKSNVDHGFFNVGTATTISVNELADIIVAEFGLNVKPIHGPDLPGDVHTTKADISQAKKLLNWEPKIGIREWLKEIISTKINLDSIID